MAFKGGVFKALVLLSFFSFILFSIVSFLSFKSSNPFAKLQTDLEQLQKDHEELKGIISNLKSGKIKPSDPAMLKYLRDRSMKFSNTINYNYTRPEVLTTLKNIDIEVDRNILQTEKKPYAASGKKMHHTILPDLQVNYGNTPSVLIIGGTDGSGTRRVVQLLTMMGIKIVSEDPETFDIHADLMGGWPTVVTPVIQVLQSSVIFVHKPHY